MKALFCKLLILMLLIWVPGAAAAWQMAWDDPNTEVKPDGYKIYYGKVSQSTVKAPAGDGTAKPYEGVVTVTPGTMRAWPLPVPSKGIIFYRMTSFATGEAGEIVESEFSEELRFKVTPNPPTGVKVTK